MCIITKSTRAFNAPIPSISNTSFILAISNCDKLFHIFGPSSVYPVLDKFSPNTVIKYIKSFHLCITVCTTRRRREGTFIRLPFCDQSKQERVVPHTRRQILQFQLCVLSMLVNQSQDVQVARQHHRTIWTTHRCSQNY
jgi:hypothetical protein